MIEKLIENAHGRTAFLEHEVKGLLKEMGFSVPKGRFIRAREKIPGDLGLVYPLIAKVSSQKISSKSDVHGLRAGLRDESELRNAVEEILRIENAEGVLVEEMMSGGVEVIVGGVLDTQFGPVMMFGLGGIFVEIFRDLSFGLAPLSKDDAYWMIKEVKGSRILDGYRGSVPADKETLVELLMGVSEIMATGLIGEIDLNPVVLYPEGAMVLDAKMKLRQS